MMKFFKLIPATIFLSAALCFGVAGIAAAGGDDVYENEIDNETELAKDDIQDEDIEAFLAAAEEVEDIRGEYSEKIRDAAEGDKASDSYEELRAEAADKMAESIEDAGLDEDTYRGIAYHLKEDKKSLIE
ncbi:MAG: DUF4168 domain-containing protein [Thermodesulfobacteriota bacterium]